MAVRRAAYQQPTIGADRAVHYYPAGPICRNFVASDAFICGILGPIGSGKSTGAVMKLIRNMQKQMRGRDGWRRRRTAVIRNTYPELKTTTIKTWHQWVPASTGNWRDSGPPTHLLIDEMNKVHWEVMFVALDRPDDVRKLLSLELSDAWVNEVRETPKAIIDGLTGRVGRYPPRDGDYGCTDAQIIMDTNAPDSDHWYAKAADYPTPEVVEERARLEVELRAVGALRADQPLVQFFRQPGARTAHAENLKNLDPGYYLKAMVDKTPEWIKVYIDAEYGFVLDGRAVYPEYRDGVHAAKEFQLSKLLTVQVGLDFGLTPAAVFGQQMKNGQWRWHSELVTQHMGVTNFAKELKRHIAEAYPGFKVGPITGDPAGVSQDHDERTAFDILKANQIAAIPAKTNEFSVRRDAVALPLTRMIDGEPGMLVHPQMLTTRKGMAGAYCFRRIQVVGQERFKDVPDKNEWSHVCEAGQYLCLGGGEGKMVVGRDQAQQKDRPAFAISDYNILG